MPSPQGSSDPSARPNGNVVEDRDRYVLLGRVRGRALIAVVADDELDDATVLISAYEPDAEHGWTTETIDRTPTRRRARGDAAMTRHTHDDGHLVERRVDHDYVVHHADDEPGLLVLGLEIE